MPEQRRSSFSGEQKCAVTCSCGDRNLMLSPSFPPYYTRLLCISGARNDSGVASTIDSNQFMDAPSERTADSGCCCVSRTPVANMCEDKELHNSATSSSNIPCKHCHHFHDDLVSGASGEYECCEDATSSLCQPDEDGDTALHLAVVHGHVRLVMYILGTDSVTRWLNHQNQLRQTPLHLSVISGHIIITKLLLQQGADPRIRDRHGNTALHLACRMGDVTSVQVLTSRELAAGNRSARCVNLLNYDGLTCLHVAASGGHTHVVQYLIEAPHIAADINQPDGCSGRTVLHNAVERRDMGVLCYLLQCHADINLDLDAVTYSGHTSLSLALGNSHYDISEFLLLAGASPQIACDNNCDDIDSDSENISDTDMDTSESMEYTDFVIRGKKIIISNFV